MKANSKLGPSYEQEYVLYKMQDTLYDTFHYKTLVSAFLYSELLGIKYQTFLVPNDRANYMYCKQLKH